MFQVVFCLVLASAQDVFLASSASAARRLGGVADGSASGGRAIVVCESCMASCTQKPAKCRKRCFTKKLCVWQADLDKAALEQAGLLDQAPLDPKAECQEKGGELHIEDFRKDEDPVAVGNECQEKGGVMHQVAQWGFNCHTCQGQDGEWLDVRACWSEWDVGACTPSVSNPDACGDEVSALGTRTKTRSKIGPNSCSGDATKTEDCVVTEVVCKDINPHCSTYVRYYGRYCAEAAANCWFTGYSGQYGCKKSCGLCQP